MALFGKKSKDAPASSPSGAASGGGTTTAGEKKRGFALGRKKKDEPAAPAAPAPAAVGGDEGASDEFFDFSDDALAAAAKGPDADGTAGSKGGKGSKKKPKPKRLKSGTVVGLNIGTDSIKAIELRVKGTEIAITGMGILATPEDSIANGVVMSAVSLSQGIREVMKQAGIKSKRVVTSVAGTGALVVRVIEVPKMSDNELEDNMKVDADRYIPFPPSEVVMDFAALRELPTDPDAPNMEVLLAAAQSEIIDSHIQVMWGAKLDPRAIDVEPLAAVRALTAREIDPNAPGADTIGGEDYVDYNDVTAIVNIGAASTEISIVRGDLLVFTRNVPTGGQTLTQAIVDYFGLHWPDAEHAKRQWGDALPQADTQATDAGDYFAQDDGTYDTGATGDAVADDAMDDWSEFGLDDPGPDAVGTSFDADGSGLTDGFDAGDATGPGLGTARLDTPPSDVLDSDPFNVPTTSSTASVAPQSIDPFDMDFPASATTTEDPAGGTPAGAPQVTAPQAADPFNLDFFSQGPQDGERKEPGEQHGQKEKESDGDAGPDDVGGTPVFDFSSFTLEDDEPLSTPVGSGATDTESNAPGDDDSELPSLQATFGEPAAPFVIDEEDVALPSTTGTPGEPATTSPAAVAPTAAPPTVSSAFDFPSMGAVGSSATAFSVTGEDDDDAALPTLASQATPGASSFAIAGLEEDDDAALPTVADAATTTGPSVTLSDVAAPAAAVGITPGAGVPSFSFDAVEPAATRPDATTPEAENFDFDLTLPSTSAASPAAVEGIPVAVEDDDFDIDSLFGDTAAVSAGATAASPATTETGLGEDGAALDAAASVSGPAHDDHDYGDGLFDNNFDTFGAGLTDTDLSGIDEHALYSVMNPILEGLAGEVRRSLEYHATRYPDAAVQHITLIGGGAKLKNIDAYFAHSMGIPTTIGNPLAGLKIQASKLPPDYVAEMGPLFVVALGLALRDLVR